MEFWPFRPRIYYLRLLQAIKNIYFQRFPIFCTTFTTFYLTVLYYRLQILIEIGKGWFFEKVMKWSRHARKIFRWHYNRLEFAVSSLWKTLGRTEWWLLQLLVFSSILISTCMNICPLALKLNYLRLPACSNICLLIY